MLEQWQAFSFHPFPPLNVLAVFSIQIPHVVLGGLGWVPNIRFSLGINSYLSLFALESTQGAEGAPDGQVLGCFRPP